MKLRTASFMALLALVPLPVAPQTNPAIPKVGETIEVSIVNLDVVVTDKRGNRVTGLTRDDFEVLEENRPQAISNFSEYRSQQHATAGESSATATSRTSEAPAPPRPPRTIVIFVDDFKLTSLSVNPVFSAIKALLHDVVQPGDSVMVIGWAMHPVIRQQPTDDLRLVDATLDKIASSSIGLRRDEMQHTREVIDQLFNFLAEAATFANLGGGRGGLRGIATAAPSIQDDDFLFQARSGAEIALYEMKEKMKALNAIVTSMSGAEGRKALFVVSHRLGFYAGGEYFFAFGDRISAPDRSRFDTSELVKSLTNNANSHGVTIYTMFPEGLPTPNRQFTGDERRIANGREPLFDEVRSNYQMLDNEIVNLKKIADETGGTMAYSAVDIAKMLPRVSEDFDSYYSLAYRIGARHDDRARSVTVLAKNRGYRVRARQHYFETSEQTEMHDRVVGNLLRAPESSSIPLEIVVGSPERKDKHVWSVPVEVRFPSSALTSLPEGGASKGGFTVYIATGRLFGSPGDVTRQTVPFTARAGSENERFEYRFDLLTDLLSEKISIGLLDEVTHEKGFAVADLPIGAAR
jgi:VWFA-related protein